MKFFVSVSRRLQNSRGFPMRASTQMHSTGKCANCFRTGVSYKQPRTLRIRGEPVRSAAALARPTDCGLGDATEVRRASGSSRHTVRDAIRINDQGNIGALQVPSGRKNDNSSARESQNGRADKTPSAILIVHPRLLLQTKVRRETTEWCYPDSPPRQGACLRVENRVRPSRSFSLSNLVGNGPNTF